MSHPPLKTAIVYPDSDGAPMAESDSARDYLTYSVEALQIHFQARKDVYVSGNLFIYYQQGSPSAVIAPDVFVIFGVENKPRMSYKTWQENHKLPQFILEITSKSTQIQDEEDKPIKYARLGVEEYFQYDPTGDYLNPQLKGSRLVGGEYQRLEMGEQGIYSEVLGLELRLVEKKLRFYDLNTGKYLPSYEEIELARQEAELARQKAELARQEAELARQEAEQKIRQAIPHLQSLGLTPEQIATSLNLTLEQMIGYQ